MESSYDYRFTRKAESDLDGIISYLAIDLSNAAAAADFAKKLQAAIDETLLFPLSGTLVNNDFLPDTSVWKKIIGNYIMYYLPDAEQHIINIVRILYGRRNLEELIRLLEP